MSETPTENLQKYRILGREGERQRVDGHDRMPGDIVEMTDDAASYYLREGRLEPAGGSAAPKAPAVFKVDRTAPQKTEG